MENNREFHAVAELFPLLRGAAFEELVADIRNNGLREEILCDAEGRILDGRNRYRACLEAGVEPRFTTWKGAQPLADLALSLNLHRRHLDESQRALVAARLAKMFEKESSKRRGARTDMVADLPPSPFGKSRAKAAAVVNVSPRLVSCAIRVVREGCPELITAVESGGLAVTPAAALAVLPHDEQARLVAGGAAQLARKVRELRGRRAVVPAPVAARPFGVLYPSAALPSAGGELTGGRPVALLWVTVDAVDDAVAALQTGGFRYASRE